MIICGIDPGLTGAIGFIDSDNGYEHVHDMPIMPRSEKKNQVDAAALAKLICSWEPDLVIIEQVQAMPGQGVASMFNFGESFGQVKGVVAALGLQTIFVRPQKWKRTANLRDANKETARLMAISLWPEAPLQRKKDSGRAEALLIAKCGAPMIVSQQHERREANV